MSETISTQQDPRQPAPKRTLAGKIGRGLAWFTGSLLLLVVLLLLGFAWYSTSADFERRVGNQVVGTLEDATGGKVELGAVHFDLWHLGIEADHLVIHGLEGPGEAPYLAADRILVRVKIISFLEHTAGTGLASHIGLSLLRVERPSVHLIVDKDGKTNQPVPKHPTPSTEPLQDTLLDLKAKQVELVHGVALVNDRAIPFNLAAQDLNAVVQYLRASDRYAATLDLRDLRTQMAKEPEARSSLHVEAQIGRDMAQLTRFDFHSGEHSELTASALLDHFANPTWQAQAAGTLELKQLQILAGVEGLDAGSLDLAVNGHNCYVAPAVAQKKPNFFHRLRSKKEAETGAPKTLPPDPECQNGYLLIGQIKLHNAAYQDQYVRLHDINGGAQLHITPTQLLFTALTGYLPGGGSATGELKINNWLGEVPANTPTASATVKGAVTTANKTSAAVTGNPNAVAANPVVAPTATAHAYLTVKVDRIPLRTIMDITAPKDYGDLGFDTSISGPVKVEWGGPATDIADTVLVDAALSLGPAGLHRKGIVDIPVSGQVLGHYDGKTEVVNLQRLEADTPQSSLVATGILGVNLGDPLTALNVDLNLRDLGEYDQLLRTLGLTGNGRKGAAAIPVDLHGSATFHGTARGAIAKLDVKGHLEANNLEVRLGDFAPAATVPVKPSPVNAAFSKTSPPGAPSFPSTSGKGGLPGGSSGGSPGAPSFPSTSGKGGLPGGSSGGSPGAPSFPGTSGKGGLLSSTPSTNTDIHIDSLIADAEYTPAGLAVASSTITQGSAVLHVAGAFKPRTVYKKKVATYVWDDGTSIDARVQLANANVVDVLTIAGQQNAVPVTGTMSLDGHAAGTLKALSGAGTVSLVNGTAYGETYQSASAALSVQGQQIEASQVTLKLYGYTIAGNGGYNLGSQRVHAHIAGQNLQLSKFKNVQNANLQADGVLSILADANGTLEQPNLKANVKLASVTVEGKPIGEAAIDVHSEGKTAFYTLRSNLIGAQVSADGQTELNGNFQTRARLTLANVDVAKPLALFLPDGPKATSNIAGVIDIDGPAKTPMALNGDARLTSFEITSQGITLKSSEAVGVTLRNGLATLATVHITGPDTDLRAGGTAQVFGALDPKTHQPSATAGKLNLNALGSVNVALAHTFDPDLITSGKVVFAVGVGGIVADPQLSGKIEFLNVNAAVNGIPNGLSNMNGTLVFNEDRLNVQSLTANTGGGQLKIGGFLTYRNGIFADLTATGDVVRVRLYGLSATANTQLRLQGGPQSATLSGNVLLTRFGVGADVDFAAFAGAGGVQAPPDPSAASNKIRLDVHVTSSPQLDFQNSYAKLAGTVDLTIRGTVNDPTVLGRIQVTDGSATFAGTKYQLQRGDVYFSNPVRIDPTVDLDATARVENYDITVGLHGTSTNLKPTYRSEPPLSEADIFALLALGRTQEEAQLYQEQQVANGTDPTTSALLGGALNATVSNRVSKLFGGGSVKIDPSFIGTLGNSTARITVQQQLSRQLTLTYATNINSSSQQLIQLQYQVSPNVSVVATRDESGVFSIVYKLRKRYR